MQTQPAAALAATLPELAALNNQVLNPAQHLPTIKLANGLQVQTGTVATMLRLVDRYNAGEPAAVASALRAAVPTLVGIGFFDLFAPADWQAGANAGRAFLGQAALDYAAAAAAPLAELAVIRDQTLAPGEHLPAVTLGSGQRVQTGTVATMLRNVTRYNAGERGELAQALRAAVPTLWGLGLFELFVPAEWVAGSDAGRTLVGEAALAYAASAAAY